MSIFKKLIDQFYSDPCQPRQEVDAVPESSEELRAQIGYSRLEQRQVLSATFGLAGGLLSLSDFDAGEDLTFSQDNVDIGGSIVDAYIFEIDSGMWSGVVGAGIELDTPDRLEVDASLVTSLFIDGNSTIDLTQSGGFAVTAFSATNFSISDASFDIDIDGLVSLGDITVTDTDLGDATETQISVQATGTITVAGALDNQSTNAVAGISLTATGLDSDVDLQGAVVTTGGGDISLIAADSVFVNDDGATDSTLTSGLAGNVVVTANSDDTAGDSGNVITMSDGSVIDATTGNVAFMIVGADGGDITLGSVTTTDGDVTVTTTAEVVDGTAAEDANITANRADFIGSAIGSADDIDIETTNLSFNAAGLVQIVDLETGVNVDQVSSAGSGFLSANSPLIISANVSLTGSFAFTAGDSAVVGDNITINNNAVVDLVAGTNETLTFTAGDDIVFDTGSVTTSGGGVHNVILTADNEAALDADRGAITNTAGATTSVTTNTLTISAAEGVGNVGNGLRIQVDAFSVVNTIGNGVFICETDGVTITGATNVGRDISVAAGGFIQITGAIDAGVGDVRLFAEGDVVQDAAGTITANELGIIQSDAALDAADDVDANSRFDIRLDANNDVDVLASTNLFDTGVVVFVDTDDLQIGTVGDQDICAGVSFASTSGITTTFTGGAGVGVGDVDGGDILLNTAGFLQIDEAINAGAGTADVRLTANGDIVQAVAGTITADELGVIQSGAALVAGNDLDTNLRYDIILDDANSVNVFAASNSFDGGVVAVNNQIDLTIDEVTGQTIGTGVFGGASGISTTYSGAAVQGGADVDSGDIIVNSEGGIQINQGFTAGNAGVADVRLTADGLIDQSIVGVIVADELGVRQESTGDIHLCSDNDVTIVAAFNNDGNVEFHDVDDFIIGGVTAQTIGNVSFLATTGFTGEDIFLFSAGDLRIDFVINAGTNDVRIIANGDVTQSAGSVIIADELGIRQEAAVYNALEDFDANGRFDILLSEANDVDFLAAFNAFDSGVVVFNDLDDLTISQVDAQIYCNDTFAQTTGISTVFTGVAVLGPLDVVNGDVLINANGFLQIDEAISAGGGAADVRLIADGDIGQAADGTISANELGLRQESLASGNIALGSANDVDVIGAENLFDGGSIGFNNVGNLVIDEVSSQTIDGTTFSGADGIQTAFTGAVGTGAGDADSGDVVVNTDGSLRINRAISAGSGNADVRLEANGDIAQATVGIITANELGVSQADATYNIANDLDADGVFDITLCEANVVDVFAGQNVFAAGDIHFDNTQGFAVDNVTAQTLGATFGGTNGVQTSDGSVFLRSAGFLNLVSPIIAGAADVRLIANGDIHQSAMGGITANRIGIRQVSNTLAAGDDLDSNSRFDVILDGNNDANEIAGVNRFDGGVFTFNDTDDLTIGEVAEFTNAGKLFDATTGITTNFTGAAVTGPLDADSGDVLITADGFLQIDQAINAGAGNADVRLDVQGDIAQDVVNGIITANELGVTQSDAAFAAGDDLDANATFDIHLCAANLIDIFGASNAFAAGEVEFNNARGFTVGEVAAQTIDGSVFAVTTGVTANNGNVFLNAEGFLQLDESINAGTGDVRLVADGDIHQAATAGITADELGVRQEGALLVAANDLDSNSRLDITLDGNNDVSEIAAINLFDSGVVVFNDTDGVTVGDVGADTSLPKTFAATTGIITTFSGAPVIGAGDLDSGDVLLSAGGFIDLAHPIIAGGGNADVRLVAHGDINQNATGVITANELGVFQQGNSLVAANDLDGSGEYDIHLCFGNAVEVFAANNQFDGGVVQFNNTQRLVIGSVPAQTIDGVAFGAQSGVIATNGDVFVQMNGSLLIEQAINAGTGDVRLVANGDIHQDATGTITGNELGVRQNATVYALAEDLDANGRFDVILDDANDVNVMAGINLFDRGVYTFNDVDDLNIDIVSALAVGDKSFAATSGVSTTFTGAAVQGAGDVDDGDILINAGGSLLISQTLSAGNEAADVRLTADGDLHQLATGLIFADELGARIESNTFSAADDIDGNGAFDIILCFENRVSFFAAENQFTNGAISFNSVVDYSLANATAQTIGNVTFVATNGVVSSGNQFLQASAGAINITSAVNAGTGTVYLIANGDVSQTVGSIITAGQLAIRQEATVYAATGDTDLNGRFDIILTDANDVGMLAAFNAFEDGQVAFNNVDNLIVSQVAEETFCAITFGLTTGIDSEGDILVQSAGSLSIEAEINADDKADDVRLIANGDIVQAPEGTIIADELGVNQEETVLNAANDFDSNSRLDILLDDANDVNQIAISNSFDGGVVTFNDINELTIEEVAAQTIGGVTFAAATGISTTFTGAEATGAGDVDNGDVLVNAGGFLQIDRAITAGGGLADVRLEANGDITQDVVTGIITANELGVNQTDAAFNAGDDLDSNGTFDVHLCAPNLVDVFGVNNAFAAGEIDFNNAQGFTVGTVSSQTINLASFTAATGVVSNNGDVFLNSEGFLDITQTINAGTADVRLIADGDIHQAAAASIIADELGVRQEAIGIVAANDLDTNGRYDVVLDGTNNDVNEFAAFSAFDGGVIAFNDADGVTVGDVTAVAALPKAFAATTGVTTTFTGAAVAGVDIDNGDVLLSSGGFIDIAQAINAGDGNADVRLVADGDINQNAVGVITANELGVIQQGNALIAANDLDSSGQYDIHLCFGNVVDVFAANDQFDGGVVQFNNTQRLVIGDVAAQMIDGITFSGQSGIVSVNGDVFVEVDGSLLIDEAINVGAGDVRLVANGDVHQSTTGTITGDELGVRQDAAAFNAAEDLDANGRFDVVLDDANDVNSLAGNNAFDRGVFAFNDVDDLNIDSVSALAVGDKSFAATTGITTTFAGAAGQGAGDVDDGDILINADGFLLISQTLSAGNELADVRLTADGDLHQLATGLILADELGARIESNTFSAADDIDSNGEYDIVLCFDNRVSFFAAENQFTNGSVLFNSVVDYSISDVSAQTIGLATFNVTSGVTSTGDQVLQSTGALTITGAINVGTGSIYLIANGDISQTAGSTITADQLAIRQEATVLVAANDVDSNLRYDIVLTDANDVGMLAAFNAFEDGQIAFNNVDNLIVNEVAAVTFCSITFGQTTGIESEGDVLVRAEGSLSIEAEINADDKEDDVRLIANGDVTQTAAGLIFADELGVRQEADTVVAGSDTGSDGEYDILLNEANDVNELAMLNSEVNGELEFNDINDLRIDRVLVQTIGQVTFDATAGLISDNGTTGGANDGLGDIAINAGGTINDGTNIPIVTGGAASFTAGADIELVNEVGDQMLIGGNASFVSNDIEVGQDSAAAGNGNVELGSLTINDDGSNAGTADVTEDDTMLLTGTNSTGTMAMTSGEDITNDLAASITVDQVQFNAANGEVRIGNRTGDSFSAHGAEVEIGVVASNASITANTSVRIDGDTPLDPALNRTHLLEPTPFQTGTDVANTLFVTSQTGFIEQTDGDLDARILGLSAVEHVHLMSVAATNTSMAIEAGDSTATVNPNQATLTALMGVNGSEVRDDLDQSISVQHRGTIQVADVANPDGVSEDVPVAFDFTGEPERANERITTSATTDGSIFLHAQDAIVVNADIGASSTGSLPQVTTYVENAAANDPTVITFGAGVIRVTGLDGAETNQGIVNNSQTQAFFGTDTDLDGDIDAFLPGTTSIIRLDAGTNSAEQLIRALYGNPGEEGYRVAFVWDSQRRFDLGFGGAQEVPNLYTVNNTTDFERYNVEIFDRDPPMIPPLNVVDLNDFTFQTDLIEQLDPEGIVYNFDTLFAKVAQWTGPSLILRIGDPRVFTTVEVRNDQDINLFVGDLASTDNSLNATSEILEATIETNGVFIPNAPIDFQRNEIEFDPPPIPVRQQVTFVENFDPPEPTRQQVAGQLSYVAVQIGDPDNPDELPDKYVIEVDGELILKNPDAEYAALDRDEPPVEILDADKNEIQKIIKMINEDENAEAGLWYKIFIDYEDGTGKKDELLFYYFKTGQEQADDLGPESDFGSEQMLQAPEPDLNEENSDKQSLFVPDGQLRFAGRVSEIGFDPRDGELIGDRSELRELRGSEKLGLSAGTLLLATLAAKKNKESMVKSEELQDDDSEVGFGRFDRLKRRVSSLMGKRKRA